MFETCFLCLLILGHLDYALVVFLNFLSCSLEMTLKWELDTRAWKKTSLRDFNEIHKFVTKPGYLFTVLSVKTFQKSFK